jgi:DNA-binding LytR/AlgR family response regulator
MSIAHPTALVADDEPLLREALVALLAETWPELRVVARARNGREAIERFEQERPDVCFLDVRMPGLSGVDAARAIGRRAHLVFVTAFDRYAVEAFDQGALDYLVKPVERSRLEETVRRLRERLAAAEPATRSEAQLERLSAQIEALRPDASAPLRWIRAQAGKVVRLIAVDDVEYLRADAKYTRVAWRDPGGQPQDSWVRTPLEQLAARLDPDRFVRVHRSVVVNLGAVAQLRRHDNDTAEIHLKGRSERLPVSRAYLPRFRGM